MRVLLDTNVFLYAAGRYHSEREACQRVLRMASEDRLDATVDSEVLQEVLYVLTRRGERQQAVALVSRIASLFPELLSITRDDMVAAAQLVGRYPDLSPRDAVHAATALRNGIKTIVSVDRDFDRIEGLRRLPPSKVAEKS